jgi:hypothetical protein
MQTKKYKDLMNQKVGFLNINDKPLANWPKEGGRRPKLIK